MGLRRISGFFYPTTAVLVDDSKAWLNSLSLQLDSDIIYRMFVDPQLAIEYIVQKRKSNHPPNGCLMTDHTNPDSGNQHLRLCIDTITAPIFNADRFNEISVIVLDYSMPIDGPAFIKKLNDKLGNTPTKIIMLTGEADLGCAVEMLNAGDIHMFLQKRGEANLEKAINDAIRKMQRAYFEEMSASVIANISHSAAPCLQDAAFIKVFYEVCKETKAVEYYLCENTGSFLLVNELGELSWMIVRTTEELQEYETVAHDQGVEPDLAGQIGDGKVIPFFGSFENYTRAKADEWADYVFPAKTIEGKNKYFYSLIKDFKHFVLPCADKKIVGFKEYIRRSWPPIN